MPHIHPIELFNHDVPLYVLSPHIDDAVWSLGGLLHSISASGQEIHLISIFTLSIYVYDEIRPPVEASAIRKGEDFTAAHASGFTDVTFLDFPDGILRDTPQTQIINPAYKTPSYFLELLCESLQTTVPKNASVLAPAGFGGHMDHITTRNAAATLFPHLWLYQDLPYSAREVNHEEARKFLKKGWSKIQMPLPDTAIQDHIVLSQLYQSQISDSVSDELRTYLQKNGVILWKRAFAA